MLLPVLFFAAAAAATGAVPEHAARVEYVRSGLDKILTSLEQKTHKPGVSITTRDLTNGAMAEILLHADGQRAAELLRLAFATQDMDEKSPHYGMLPWETANREISDMNAIEFGTQSMGPLLLRYKDKLPAGLVDDLMPHLRAAFVALERHDVKVSYTNIFLMKTVNMILIAEALGDKETEAKGRKQLEDWVEYTNRAGVHEFDSPTYTSVDLNSLFMGALYSTDPALRTRFHAILDYFWTDIAANFFPGRDKLAGPYSRDYDFLTGHGGLQIQTYLSGISIEPSPQTFDMEKIYMLENELNPGGYRPNSAAIALAHQAGKIIESKYDLEPNRDRYHYVAKEFATGSASGEYNPQDKFVNIELASSKDLADITVVPDKQDNPYGKVKSKDRSGHSKPTHIPPHATSVQDHGSMLVLLDLDPSREGEVESLATNLVLPSNADTILLDGKPVDVAAAFQKDATAKSVVAVREGNGIAVLRIFEAGAVSTEAPRFVLQAEKEGLKYNALRYTAYHYRGAARKLPERHVRVGILTYTGSCSSDRQCAELIDRVKSAEITSHADEHMWSVRAKVGSTELTAVRDLDRRTILSRQVNGQPFGAQLPLAINGKAVEVR